MAPPFATKKKSILYQDIIDHPESSSSSSMAERSTITFHQQINLLQDQDLHDNNLKLTLLHHPLPPPSPEQQQPLPPLPLPPQPAVIPAPRRQRRNPRQGPRPGKSLTIEPPYPWATNRRAMVHTVKHLTDTGITAISGDVHCKRCDQFFEIEYNLKEKFMEIATYIVENKDKLRDRAPPIWKNPTLPNCRLCGQENSVKPVISKKKNSINWLFLLLGKLVGCCTLEQLKYFCKHTGNHRTAAKDRVLYLTYLGLCKQLDPDGPFHYRS